MKQLTQKLKDGQMQVLDVPMPDLRPGCILVRNYYSLISSGTEGSTVSAARKGYLGKAKEKPQQVKQVLDKIRTEGFLQTYRAVMKKLDAYSPLGYSSVGEVMELGGEVRSLKVGDMVACGGLSACHAEVVSVPENLCVKIPPGNGLEPEDHIMMAAYNTLGAIAMQGVRQADLRLGETCAVIGLGLLGHLACILLRVSGVRVIGIDIDPVMVELAGNHCVDIALAREDAGIESKTWEFTNGIGCDAVIITAASKSPDPINLAGALARKRGTIVIVGDVGTGFDRDPHFYKKELAIKMSCSYGPGRYDPDYEEKGRDYPAGYVRWTEKRNMQTFQELVAEGKIDLRYLTTHIFKLEQAPKAYDTILEKLEPCLGILIEYDRTREISMGPIVTAPPKAAASGSDTVTIGFIGAGSYAQGHLLPNISKGEKVILKGVMTSSATTSRSVADRYGFEFCTGDAKDIVSSDAINTVFIATRHDTHARYVVECLKAGKNVFVEKPLCIKEEELREIEQTYSSVAPHSPPPLLMVGFNRRFSPLTETLKEGIGSGPMAIMYRINAGTLPADSWIQDKEIGGGRIIGEVCHFVDFITCLVGSEPIAVYAATMADPLNQDDTLTVSLNYRDGSIGSIHYYANGSRNLSKEYLEIYSHGVTGTLRDFREIEIFGKGKSSRKKLLNQDKGQKNEVKSFIDLLLKGGDPLIPVEQIFSATRVTFKIVESLRTGKAIRLE